MLMPTIKFLKEKKSIEVPAGANLRKAAMKAGVQVYPGIHQKLHCPGLGLCTTCKVYIKQGHENVSKKGIWESLSLLGLFNPLAFWARLGHEDELRLSCQTKVYGDIEVETQPELNWHGERFWG